ncbi:TPA: lpg2745 family Dot/Icm T4SS effector, partial [Legionella pneumophila]|nr:lpg2745 family Dot/Icm T4SS effector [Legionella pneumophila]HAU2170330.1 lpg2745 family Dot/Icm T4SS effector [Legionella pneumophila]
SGADFKLFTAEIHKFFKTLYQFKLENINFLYGVKILYHGKEYYLLELFVLINMAQSYDVDEQLKAIMSWLYQFNPILKASNKGLLSFYTELEPKFHSEGHLEKRVETGTDDLLYRIKTFLVSLFVIPFEVFPFSGKTISFWDIKNVIFSEGQEIYNQFAPFIMTNKLDTLIAVYKKIMDEHIIPCQKNKHICKWLTHYQSTLDWYQRVEAGELSKMDVYWFDPELLFHVLVHFRLINKSLGEKIVNFLDELIHTYAQNNNEFQIHLRVNILFSRFLKSLDEQQRRKLILTLSLFDPVEAKSKFLTNCIHYVTNRLCQISMHQLDSSPNFFGTYQCIDSKKLLINKTDVKQVSAILEAFKEMLHSLEERCNPEQLENMLIFLRSISRPILTVAEIEEAQQSARVIDYIGAPT